MIGGIIHIILVKKGNQKTTHRSEEIIRGGRHQNDSPYGARG
jgi:hypothetical protein